MKYVALLFLVVIAVGCGGSEPASKAPAPTEAPEAPEAPKASAAPRIVFLGDSLTAGLGLPSEQSYPSLIGKRLKESGLDFQIVNAGVSGDTSAGGLRRLDWSLDGDVKLLVVALGANDGLRGLPTKDLKKNLATILDRAREKKVPVLLAGMEAPPNNGPDYTRDFRNVYTELAKEYDVRFIPFLLYGVAGEPSLNQPDGIHPNEKGAELVADLVWSELVKTLSTPKPLSP